MAINSNDLLRLAMSLSASSSEVKRRAAIGRAYYAAYHRCLDWEQALPGRGDHGQLHGSHERLIARLKHPHHACDAATANESRHLGGQLEKQRGHRTMADYRIKGRLPPDALEEQLQLAQEILALCDRPIVTHAYQRLRCQLRPSANR